MPWRRCALSRRSDRWLPPLLQLVQALPRLLDQAESSALHLQEGGALEARVAAANNLDILRGVEGEAARTYFEALNRLGRPDRREAFTMSGRSRRPPRDRMNGLLSFLYAMWMNDCRSACEAAGLDAQVGFLPALRPGRAALALDLMEEFRPFADRLALSLVNRAQLNAGDFDVREGGAVTLRDDARKAVVVAFQERKQEALTHPVLAESLPLGLVPLVQARLLARCVRGDTDSYIPFTTK